MRVIVTGGRDYSDIATVRREFEALGESCVTCAGEYEAPTIIHGGARGADALAEQVAGEFNMPSEVYPADWRAPCRPTCRAGHRRPRGCTDYCPAAGNYRNQEMIDAGADLVLAFSGGAGTADCVRRARAAGIEVREVS